MDKEERITYPCKSNDLVVYTDMKMFLVALEQAEVSYQDLYWCILNDKNKKLFALMVGQLIIIALVVDKIGETSV